MDKLQTTYIVILVGQLLAFSIFEIAEALSDWSVAFTLMATFPFILMIRVHTTILETLRGSEQWLAVCIISIIIWPSMHRHAAPRETGLRNIKMMLHRLLATTISVCKLESMRWFYNGQFNGCELTTHTSDRGHHNHHFSAVLLVWIALCLAPTACHAATCIIHCQQMNCSVQVFGL